MLNTVSIYISKLEIRSRIDAELAEIARQEEARILAEEKAKKEAELATLKEEEDLNDIIIETDIETKEERIINVHGEWGIYIMGYGFQ